MRKFILLFAMALFAVACASKNEMMPNNEEKNNTMAIVNRLKLSSKADLSDMLARVENGLVSTKSSGGDGLLDPTNPGEIEEDPILQVDCKASLEEAIEEGLTNEELEECSVYDLAGYDTLVPNIALASLLNKRGEIQIADTIYKVSPMGTYYFHESKLEDFEDAYEELENIPNDEDIDAVDECDDDSASEEGDENGTNEENEENEEDTAIPVVGKELRPGIFRYNTFHKQSKHELVVSSKSSNQFGYDIYNTYHLFDYNWDNAQRYSVKSKTIAGKFLNYLFGYNSRHDQYIGNYHRLKGGLYSYNYVIYHETGITANFQKKKLFWKKSNADELFLGWKNIVLFTPYSGSIPTPEKTKMNTIGLMATNVNVEVPLLSQKRKTAYITGLTLTKAQINTIVDLYPQQIAGYLSNLSGNKLNLSGISYFHLFTDSGVYTIIPGFAKIKKNTGRLAHVFSKGWSFDTNIPQALLAKDWKQTWNNIKKFIKSQKSDLVAGEGAIACYFDGKYRGMIFYKEY